MPVPLSFAKSSGYGWTMTHMTDLYQARVDAGQIQPDPAQEAVLPEFDRIAEGLRAEPVKRGLFRKAVREEVKGLYLWGGVGRGKSMLMDLFVESLDDIPSRRVHFHAFMQEIHAKMHLAREVEHRGCAGAGGGGCGGLGAALGL